MSIFPIIVGWRNLRQASIYSRKISNLGKGLAFVEKGYVIVFKFEEWYYQQRRMAFTYFNMANL
ncbi:hypothetical protein B4U37_06100 [Sutcliffiella horikoshii]|uniref:Uncharacterized protein n=1 Tax=Sutcliffiella horikoshii TaxID=79883 RepID=A0ABN4ZEQ6_9BACI|nr:hypothetical protein B4U37_06100 [Sutcliffiella horikoshii]